MDNFFPHLPRLLPFSIFAQPTNVILWTIKSRAHVGKDTRPTMMTKKTVSTSMNVERIMAGKGGCSMFNG